MWCSRSFECVIITHTIHVINSEGKFLIVIIRNVSIHLMALSTLLSMQRKSQVNPRIFCHQLLESRSVMSSGDPYLRVTQGSCTTPLLHLVLTEPCSLNIERLGVTNVYQSLCCSRKYSYSPHVRFSSLNLPLLEIPLKNSHPPPPPPPWEFPITFHEGYGYLLTPHVANYTQWSPWWWAHTACMKCISLTVKIAIFEF